MKLTKSQLRKLIKEELQNEGMLPSGHFDFASLGRSSGPEYYSEEKYKKKAQEALDYLEQYDDIIEKASYLQNIDTTLLYGILIDEYMRMYPRALFDIFGYIGLVDTSVGIAQVRGKMARKLKDYYDPKAQGHTTEDVDMMSQGQIQRLMANNPEISINYAAAWVKWLEENWGPALETVDPESRNAILGTLYSLGGAETPRLPVAGQEYRKPKASMRGSRLANIYRSLKPNTELAMEALSRDTIRKLILQELKQIELYKKYTFGIDDITDKTKGHEEIIGHT